MYLFIYFILFIYLFIYLFIFFLRGGGGGYAPGEEKLDDLLDYQKLPHSVYFFKGVSKEQEGSTLHSLT